MCVCVAALVYVNTNMYNSYISVLLQTKGKLICAFIYFFILFCWFTTKVLEISKPVLVFTL